jgi:hypothetical protein
MDPDPSRSCCAPDAHAQVPAIAARVPAVQSPGMHLFLPYAFAARLPMTV